MKYLTLIIIGLFAGCASNKTTYEEEFHLLYLGDNLAYKSITIEDIKVEDF